MKSARERSWQKGVCRCKQSKVPSCLFDVDEAQDLRNHGDSPHNPHHNYGAMSDDIARFIEEHKLEDPTLIGHSMYAGSVLWLWLNITDRP